MARTFCTACGVLWQEDSKFCTSCGASLVSEEPTVPPVQAAPVPEALPHQVQPQPATQPAYPPTAYVQQPGPPPRKKSCLPKACGFGCLGVLLLVVGLVVLTLVGGGTTGGGGEFARYDLSADQQRVVEEFGLPRTFTIVYGADVEGAVGGGDLDTHRIEFWDYYEMGTRFVFRDGAVVGTREIEPLGSEFDYPALSPRQFIVGMSADEVSEVMGGEFTGSAQVSGDVAEGLEVLVWDGVLSCTFEDGGLVAAETAPVIIEEVAQ